MSGRPRPASQLRFPLREVPKWAGKYNAGEDRAVEGEIGPRIRREGFLTKADFLALCSWKSRRPKRHHERNEESTISEVTAFAFRSQDERVRILAPQILNGVSWPTASVLLHFAFDNRYPILDFRALWSLGIETPPGAYGYEFWEAYADSCRSLAEQAGVSMRVLDRALWKYSDKQQGGQAEEDAALAK